MHALHRQHVRPRPRQPARHGRAVEVDQQPALGRRARDAAVPAHALVRVRLHVVELHAGDAPGAPAAQQRVALRRGRERVPARPEQHADVAPARVRRQRRHPGRIPAGVDEHVLPARRGRRSRRTRFWRSRLAGLELSAHHDQATRPGRTHDQSLGAAPAGRGRRRGRTRRSWPASRSPPRARRSAPRGSPGAWLRPRARRARRARRTARDARRAARGRCCSRSAAPTRRPSGAAPGIRPAPARRRRAASARTGPRRRR